MAGIIQPMRVGLTYTQMKLGWAYKRLDQLQVEVEKFRNDAYTIVEKDDLEHSLHIIDIEQKITPDSIGMLLGEFAYALRSGLDHLAWQLALLATDNPGRQTAFPIDSECPSLTNRSYREKIADIPGPALAIIESLQPYKNWPAFKNHPLWQLNRLCNIDEHQVVAINSIPFRVETTPVLATFWPNLKNRIKVTIPLSEKDKLQLKVNVPAVIFGEPIEATDAPSNFEITMDGLRKIYDFVRYDAVPRFESFFA